VRKPALADRTAQPSLKGKEQPQLSKEPELPTAQVPQLPQMNASTTTIIITTNTTTEEKFKTKKPQIITSAKKESPEQIKGVGKLSSSTAEASDIENPTQRQKTTSTIDNEDSNMKGKGNRKVIR
jgi:hypothetical protein